jgi:hypothetical protein
MKNLIAHPQSAALISLLLALPFAAMFLMLVLHIEPPLGPLEPYLKPPADEPAILGSAIVLGAWLLSLAAFFISLGPITRGLRAGQSLTAHPIKLALSVTILFFVTAFVGAIVVDQYSCWIGVPNCD